MLYLIKPRLFHGQQFFHLCFQHLVLFLHRLAATEGAERATSMFTDAYGTASERQTRNA